MVTLFQIEESPRGFTDSPVTTLTSLHYFSTNRDVSIITNMNKPILLLKNDLVKPINQAIKRLQEIRQRKMNNEDSIILEGLFVLAVSSFENSIIDTIRILLNRIPEKLDVKSESITKDQLIDGSPLKQAIENKVNAVSFKNVKEIINYFTRLTGIDNDISNDENDFLIEIKATRNLLIHNNLNINDIYKETAGPKIRQGSGFENRLIIDQDYLFRSLITLISILTKFESNLQNKFSSFTRVRAIRKLFDYIFQTPVMNFDDEFEIDNERDVISRLKPNSTRKESLSSSERFYYDVWVAHSHGKKFEFEDSQFFRLSNKEKFGFFIQNINLLKS